MASAYVFGALSDAEARVGALSDDELRVGALSDDYPRVVGHETTRVGQNKDEDVLEQEQEGSGEATMDDLAEEEDPLQLPRLMFQKVIASDLVIKSQQRDEPELTYTQKIEILSELLQNRPSSFLMRFGSLLDYWDLTYFYDKSNVCSSDYEVKFRADEIEKRLSSGVKETCIRNRRYAAIRELTETSQYFSEAEMRERNPMLFEHYIGQYLTEEERTALDASNAETPLSALIMKKIESSKRSKLLQLQREHEQALCTEEERDSASSEDEEVVRDHSSSLSVTVEERQMMKREFLRVMQLNFLSGQDSDFDYSKVDGNEKYDLLDMQQRDAEDSYFDTEEPAWCEGGGGARESSDGQQTVEND